MNLLDGLIGGIRKVFVRGIEAPTKNALEFRDMDVVPQDDRLVISVSGIAGVPVSSTKPTRGQALVFDGEKWVPSNVLDGAPRDAQYVVMDEHPGLSQAYVLLGHAPFTTEKDGGDASVYLDSGPLNQPQLLRWTGRQWSTNAQKPEISKAAIMPQGSPLHTMAVALEEIGAIKIV